MSAESPFTITRFEYERKHLYYLPASLFAELENPIPTYIVGSRGTGKTTLLKALTWQERLKNKSLQQQLPADAFAGRYIGCYFKLPEVQLQLLDKWLADSDNTIHSTVLAFFIDLVWLELVADSIAELVSEEILAISPEEEHDCVAAVVEKYSDVFGSLGGASSIVTLKSLARALRAAKRRIERAALRRVSVAEVVDAVETDQVGAFGRDVSEQLGDLCDHGNGDEERIWHFVICMDEGECLTPFQQKVINTLVRLAKWPAFPVIAFVSLREDLAETLIPKLTLQKADRQLHILDRISDGEFKELADGVGTIRVRAWLKDDTASFAIDDLLGRISLNEILEELLQASVRPEAKRLLELASNLSELPFFSQNDDEEEKRADGPLPIYQAYLVDRLQLAIPVPTSAGWERRRQDSAELRKRMVAAYLSICNEFGISVRYASGETLRQMSDKCIRDFLSQTEEIFRESKKALQDFLEAAIPRQVQYAALQRASASKRDSLPDSGIRSPLQTGRVVDGLARITAIIQSRGRNCQHLRSSERGIFEIQTGGQSPSSSVELKLLVDAAEAGFLRLLETEGPTWRLRVHASLAAAYGFSYRGAYYNCRLALRDVHRLSEAPGQAALDSIVKEVGDRLAGSEGDDMPLFTGKI